MHMILFNPNLKKNNLISFGDFQTYFLENQINLFHKYNPPIFGRTHQMIQEY